MQPVLYSQGVHLALIPDKAFCFIVLLTSYCLPWTIRRDQGTYTNCLLPSNNYDFVPFVFQILSTILVTNALAKEPAIGVENSLSVCDQQSFLF